MKQVEALSVRHDHEYFVGKTAEEIQNYKEEGILEFILPLKPIVKEDLNKFLLRNEKLLIKKLSWAFSAAEDFGNEFRTKLNNGQIASLTAAKTEAAKLHRLNSNKYDRTRATRVMSVDRQTIVNNRNRREGEAEYQYRRRVTFMIVIIYLVSLLVYINVS